MSDYLVGVAVGFFLGIFLTVGFVLMRGGKES